MDPLALYGASLATATAAWRIVSEVRARRPRLRVDGSLVLIISTETQARDLATSRAGGAWPEVPWRAELTVVNAGHAEVEVSEVFLRQASNQGVRRWHSTAWDLPRTLNAEQSCRLAYSGNAEDRLALGESLTAIAVTGTGRRFQSHEFGTSRDAVVAMRRAAFEAATGSDIEDIKGAFVYEVTIADEDEGSGGT